MLHVEPLVTRAPAETSQMCRAAYLHFDAVPRGYINADAEWRQ